MRSSLLLCKKIFKILLLEGFRCFQFVICLEVQKLLIGLKNIYQEQATLKRLLSFLKFI